MKSTSIILTIYNQESIIKSVIQSILDNKSENVKEIIVIFDGCVDKSEEYTKEILDKVDIDVIYEYADDIFELKCNNIGLKKSTCNYSMIIQDDMIIQEKDFDLRMVKPFEASDTFAVTSRLAHNYSYINGKIGWDSHAGFDPYNTAIIPSKRNVFSIRDVCNRGPLVLDNLKTEKLNYLSEVYLPQGTDDHDICLRAWEKYGWVSGSFWIKWTSDINMGSTRKDLKKAIWFGEQDKKNALSLKHRHFLYFVSNQKHNENRIIK